MIYKVETYQEGDPCPQCTTGVLEETDFGLSCDTCAWDILDKRKFPKGEDDGDVQEA